MTKNKQQIYVIEIDQVFSSVSEAARAVAADVSNVRKALSGQRKSAGGYHFKYIEREDQKAQARIDLSQSYARKESKQIISKARKDLLSEVHDRLVSVNLRARNAKKEGLLAADPILQKIMSHTDFFGAHKTGGYNTSLKNLRQYSDEQLQHLLELIAGDQAEYAQQAYSSDTRTAASFAAQFGISELDLGRYWAILPSLFEMYKLAKQDTEFKYNNIVAEINRAMQEGEDPFEILSFVLNLKNFYQGNSKQDLSDIMQRWAEDHTGEDGEWEVF